MKLQFRYYLSYSQEWLYEATASHYPFDISKKFLSNLLDKIAHCSHIPDKNNIISIGGANTL